MTPKRYFSDMMRSPNFRNETYMNSGGKMEDKIIKFFKSLFRRNKK